MTEGFGVEDTDWQTEQLMTSTVVLRQEAAVWCWFNGQPVTFLSLHRDNFTLLIVSIACTVCAMTWTGSKVCQGQLLLEFLLPQSWFWRIHPPRYELCFSLFFIIVYGRSNNSEEKEAFTAFPEQPTEISSVGESCDLSAKNALWVMA